MEAELFYFDRCANEPFELVLLMGWGVEPLRGRLSSCSARGVEAFLGVSSELKF